MFTDNSTVEACSVKGSSTSPKLLGLIVCLTTITTLFGTKIHIFHAVPGTRMISQGTEGVLGEGIMSGKSKVSFIPIHLSCTERSPLLIEWIRDWSSTSLIHLHPIDWFDVRHDIDGWRKYWDGFERPRLSGSRCYLWTPPPFAADVTIAELRKSRIKRQVSSHVFILPKLCSPLWVTQIYKAADIVCEVPAGQPLCDSTMHEPLLIALIFPFLRVKPWQLRSTPKMYSMGGELRKVFKTEGMDARDILRELWRTCHRLTTMPENVVRKVLIFGKHQ